MTLPTRTLLDAMHQSEFLLRIGLHRDRRRGVVRIVDVEQMHVQDRAMAR